MELLAEEEGLVWQHYRVPVSLEPSWRRENVVASFVRTAAGNDDADPDCCATGMIKIRAFVGAVVRIVETSMNDDRADGQYAEYDASLQ